MVEFVDDIIGVGLLIAGVPNVGLPVPGVRIVGLPGGVGGNLTDGVGHTNVDVLIRRVVVVVVTVVVVVGVVVAVVGLVPGLITVLVGGVGLPRLPGDVEPDDDDVEGETGLVPRPEALVGLKGSGLGLGVRGGWPGRLVVVVVVPVGGRIPVQIIYYICRVVGCTKMLFVLPKINNTQSIWMSNHSY